MPLVEVQRIGWECDRCGDEVQVTVVGKVPTGLQPPSGWKIVCGDCASLMPPIAVADTDTYRTTSPQKGG